MVPQWVQPLPRQECPLRAGLCYILANKSTLGLIHFGAQGFLKSTIFISRSDICKRWPGATTGAGGCAEIFGGREGFDGARDGGTGRRDEGAYARREIDCRTVQEIGVGTGGHERLFATVFCGDWEKTEAGEQAD